jgi:NADPH-dependent 2,4-dienoyl-CoA reductase/sulfur reductase-like enzyme/nitrite reductase/ring-hydroxylating ferredoxin subunit
MMGHAPELSGPDLAVGIVLSDLVENVPLLGHAHGNPVVLVRTGTTIRAVGATCSHYSGPLAEGLVVGETVRCPWHHACFDLRTGEALGAPALDPIPCYEVIRNGDRVAVGAKQSRVSPPAPPKTPANIVIAGAGAAGAAAAERLRSLGFTGSIALVGNEAPGPVDRPNLSKDFLAGTAPMEWVRLRDDEFYEKLKIEFIRDEAVAVNSKDKSVALKSGRKLSYDKLLLAPGSEPMRLPTTGASLPHVKTLRTLADSQSIIDAAKPGGRAVVIGSSFIGLEVAASLRARNLEVDVVSRDQVPLQRVLGTEVGRFVLRLHEAKGVHFHLGATLREIHAQEVELEDGSRLAADVVVLGVGVKPRTDLARNAGLAVDDGIVVDSCLRTSVADIWAAGDVARYPESRLGTRIRVEHWAAAQRQGQCVASDMLGLGVPFNDVPFFWTQHYDVTLSYVGHAGGDAQIEVIGNLEKQDATVVYQQGGRVAAVLTVGRDHQSLEIEAALERHDASAVDALLQRIRTDRDAAPSAGSTSAAR